MRSWILWGPLAIITLLGAGMVFRASWKAANLTETDVINAYADRYVAEVAGRASRSDCAAVPGQGAVWLIVRCGSGDTARTYPVDRSGALVDLPREPQT